MAPSTKTLWSVLISAGLCCKVDGFQIVGRIGFQTKTISRVTTYPELLREANRKRYSLPLYAQNIDESTNVDNTNTNKFSSQSTSPKNFDLTTALFCAGLAFDAYSEPEANSPRWEKGAGGTNIAFMSASFTRSLYRGLVEITPKNVTDLPNEKDSVEGVLSGSGVDPYFLVAISEGKWGEEDKALLKDRFSKGVLDLTGSAHIIRSTTAWSNVNKNQALANVKKNANPKIKNDKSPNGNFSTGYYEPSSWGRGGRAFWIEEPSYYLYVREPEKATLVLTIMDEDVVGEDDVVGSTSVPLSELVPSAGKASNMKELVKLAKEAVIKKAIQKYGRAGVTENIEISPQDIQQALVQEWEGTLKLKTKPRNDDKKGQVALGAMAGAMVAGPAGAAVGGFIGNLIEENVRGTVGLKLRYLPIPETNIERKRYEVKGGLPGVDWGRLYFSHLKRISSRQDSEQTEAVLDAAGDDLEICAFVTHERTGCSCVLYRSLEKRMIAVSFRGTCAPIDLITDASILQTPWVEVADPDKKRDEDKPIPFVHQGFRNSLNSISRRLKELVLAAVAPGEDLSQYDLLVTGHSLGGALATLFAADIAEYGMDAGRGLPQEEPSDPWWNAVVTRFFSDGKDGTPSKGAPPPRPKSLRLYSFGSPRVGDDAFVKMFDDLQRSGKLDESYRVVNNADVVARLPRTVNIVLGSVGYDHCGATALITVPKEDNQSEEAEVKNKQAPPLVWVEGESDDKECPVRDGTPLTSPLGEGMLLGDLFDAVRSANEDQKQSKEDLRESYTTKLSNSFGKVSNLVAERLQSLSATDLVSIFGIDKKYAEREAKIIQSIATGEALAHHMEDEYFSAMGRACGFIARVGEELIEIPMEGDSASPIDENTEQSEALPT